MYLEADPLARLRVNLDAARRIGTISAVNLEALRRWAAAENARAAKIAANVRATLLPIRIR